MSVRGKVKQRIEKNEIGNKVVNDRRYRTVTFATFSLIFNLLYALYNGALGLINSSVWLLATCFYYLLLGAMRFSAVIFERKNVFKNEITVMQITGFLLSVMSIVLGVILVTSVNHKTASKYGTITMITIATYTFTKLITMIVKAVHHRGQNSPLLKALHSIRYSEVAVSVASMQQSMLMSFGNMSKSNVRLFNTLTGVGVCLFVLSLGIYNIVKAQKEKKSN